MNGKKEYMSLFLRYLALVVVAIIGFGIFYWIFSPLTVYPIYWILSIFYETSLFGNLIFANSFPIEIVGACIAGSAYSFLLILNLSVPKIKPLKRTKMILVSFAIFFIINLIRIIALSFMYIEGSAFFDFTHKLFWFLGSTIFVIAIWFIEVKIFKIKGIPIYSDLKNLYGKSSLKKSNRNARKKNKK